MRFIGLINTYAPLQYFPWLAFVNRLYRSLIKLLNVLSLRCARFSNLPPVRLVAPLNYRTFRHLLY